MNVFSPAQIAGYAAFFLGVTAFLQKNDRRLKFFSASQSLVYCLHFLMLGNLPASASSLIASARSFLALKYRSLYVVSAVVLVNLAAGAAFARGAGAGWLPVIASCMGTIAIFTMEGVPLRSVLLVCTLMWLANNILSRSIGGTLLELFIASINISTMIRMSRAEARRQPGMADPTP